MPARRSYHHLAAAPKITMTAVESSPLRVKVIMMAPAMSAKAIISMIEVRYHRARTASQIPASTNGRASSKYIEVIVG